MKYLFVISLIMMCYGMCAVATQSLNILVVVGLFPKRSETFILNQITRLEDRGHNVKIHSILLGKLHEACEAHEKYKLLERTTYGSEYPGSLDEFDIIYCQFGTQGTKMLKQKQKQQNKVKIVTCFRGSDITNQLKKKPKSYNKLVKEGDLFLPVCDYFAQKLLDLGADLSKVHVHHSAIDLSLFTYRKRKPKKKNETINIISVSRLVEKKGIGYAIKAVGLLRKKHPHIHYTLVGGGRYKSGYAKIIKQFGLDDCITLTGALSHTKVVKKINEADIMILPSITAKNGNQEGIPNVLKEAMACGIPVVSTHHAGIPELVEDGVSGLLVPERDVIALADALSYLIEHQELWETMGAVGRKKVEQEFDIEKMLDKLENHFYSLVEY